MPAIPTGIEPFGIDECWLDVTASTLLFGSGFEIAERLRREVREELGVTISVGVSFCKVFAKLGSDLKKPDATSEITRDNFRQIVWPMPVQDLLGVGRATREHMAAMGIYTVGQLAQFDRELLRIKLGKNGEALWMSANGWDTTPVALVDAGEEIKSVGNSVTCPKDLTDREGVWKVLMLVAESVSHRLREKRLCAGAVVLTVKDSDFHYLEHTHRLEYSCRGSLDLARAAMQAFDERYRWKRPVRAVGCGPSIWRTKRRRTRSVCTGDFPRPAGRRRWRAGWTACGRNMAARHPPGDASGGGTKDIGSTAATPPRCPPFTASRAEDRMREALLLAKKRPVR